jgi:hypothetical protein
MQRTGVTFAIAIWRRRGSRAKNQAPHSSNDSITIGFFYTIMRNAKKLILLMIICLGIVKVVTPANSINIKSTSHTEQEAATDVTNLLRSAYNALEAKEI